MTGPADGARPALRPLTTADVPGVLALERELFGPSAWTEAMVVEELGGAGRWYVGLDGPGAARTRPLGPVGSPPPPPQDPGTELIGYVGAGFDGEVVEVMTIGVAQHAQRQGLGGLLLESLVDRARLLGATAVLLEVRVDNAAAISLYERTGFTVLRRRRRYYQPEDVDAWTMRKEL